MRLIGRLLGSQQGQGLVEYAYIMLFVALAAVAAFTTLGINVLDLVNRYAQAL